MVVNVAAMDEFIARLDQEADEHQRRAEAHRQSLCHMERLRQAQMAFLDSNEEERVKNAQSAQRALRAHDSAVKKRSPLFRRQASETFDATKDGAEVFLHRPRLDHKISSRSSWMLAKHNEYVCADPPPTDQYLDEMDGRRKYTPQKLMSSDRRPMTSDGRPITNPKRDQAIQKLHNGKHI